MLLGLLAVIGLPAACVGSPAGDSAGVAETAETEPLEASVREVIYWEGQPAAALVVDNASGVIVDSVVVGETAAAPLGGGTRPAGSVMKVLVLAAAVEFGMRPDDVIEVPSCLIVQQHRLCTNPGDYTLTEAVTASVNPVFVLLSDDIPRGEVVSQGSRFGMRLEETSVIPLGVDPVAMESVAALFVAIANDGETKSIIAQDGSTVIAASGRYLSQTAASEVRSLLRSVVTDGTGVAADGADTPFGKTGTAFGQTDAWFVGSTAAHTIVVWVGAADGAESRNRPLSGSLSGGGWPAQIFRKVADGLGRVAAR